MARRTERRYVWKLESLGNHEDDGDKTSQIRILKNERPVFLHALLVRFLHFCNFEDVLLVTRKLKGSLSTRVCKTRTATGRGHFSYQDSGVCQIFIRIISNREKIISNVNVVVWRQIKREDRSLPVAVRVSTATTTTTPQINDLIGWMKKNNRATRAARSLVHFFDVVCQTTTWNFQIGASDDNASSPGLTNTPE